MYPYKSRRVCVNVCVVISGKWVLVKSLKDYFLFPLLDIAFWQQYVGAKCTIYTCKN